MSQLSYYELYIFCKTAKTINKKGHLEQKAILKFINSKDHKKDRKVLEKLYKLRLLQRHRTNTYELTPIGRMFSLDKCEWFRERHFKGLKKMEFVE